MTDTPIYEPTPLVIQQPQNNLTNLLQSVKLDEIPYWQKEEVLDKLSRVSNHKDKMLLTFLWMTGCRITEVISLKKQDIDFQHYLIKIRWLKSRKHTERILPMHPQLKQVLELYTAPLKLDEYVFPYSRQRAWQIVRHWFGGHPHQFRHSFAVFWLQCGGSLEILSKVLGHSNINTTMIYHRVVPMDQGKELIKLNFL